MGTSGSGARISSLDANSYILEHAASLAAQVLAVDASADPHATSSLLAWVMTHIRLSGSAVPRQVKVTEVALSALMALLRNDTVRRLFVEEKGLERLVPLASSRNAQLLYEAGFCLWSLSLSAEFCPVLERVGAVTSVARLLRTDMPAKVLRVSAGEWGGSIHGEGWSSRRFLALGYGATLPGAVGCEAPPPTHSHTHTAPPPLLHSLQPCWLTSPSTPHAATVWRKYARHMLGRWQGSFCQTRRRQRQKAARQRTRRWCVSTVRRAK